MRQDSYDVIILGGGLAGLTLALQIERARPATSVLVVERELHPVPEAAFKVGEATGESAAHYFSNVLGLREHLDSAQIRKMGLRFFLTAGDNHSIAERREAGPRSFLACRTYMLDRGRLENALVDEVVAAGVDVLDGCKVRDFTLSADGHTVTAQRQGEQAPETFRARWLVDASGRAGLIKRRLGLAESTPHEPNAVWFRLADPIQVDDFGPQEPAHDAEAWRTAVPERRRWLSTTHLMGRGYWIWLIPLASGSISVGLVADPRYVPFEDIHQFGKLLAWLRGHEPQLADAVEQRKATLQDFKVMKHFSHGCKQVFSADRWCLTGEAGVFLDPLYSPGSDFIAVSNTYITDLVARDLCGDPRIAERIAKYNDFYLHLFHSALPTWQDQYAVMGNAQVWPMKVVWDTLIYFGVLSLTFVNGRLNDWEYMNSTVKATWERFGRLNRHMQGFFREWDRMSTDADATGFVDLSTDLFYRYNAGLLERLDADQFEVRLAENVDFLATLATEIQQSAALSVGLVTAASDIDPYTFALASEERVPLAA